MGWEEEVVPSAGARRNGAGSEGDQPEAGGGVKLMKTMASPRSVGGVTIM